MDLCRIQTGMTVKIITIPQGTLKNRLRQFGFVEGTSVTCRYARKRILALEWMGTVVAVRRKDLMGFAARVIG